MPFCSVDTSDRARVRPPHCPPRPSAACRLRLASSPRRQCSVTTSNPAPCRCPAGPARAGGWRSLASCTRSGTTRPSCALASRASRTTSSSTRAAASQRCARHARHAHRTRRSRRTRRAHSRSSRLPRAHPPRRLAQGLSSVHHPPPGRCRVPAAGSAARTCVALRAASTRAPRPRRRRSSVL